MGQRLNLEIHDSKVKGNWNLPTASAYYHWSGYSESAVEILQIALKALKETDEPDGLLRAIKVLQATGAEMPVDELNRAKEAEMITDWLPTKAADRNDGLIAITEHGMKETRTWEEGRVEIHLNNYSGNDYVKFACFWKEDLQEHLREYDQEAETESDDKGIKHTDFNFDHIEFDKVDELEEIVKNNDSVLITTRIGFIK